MFLISGNVLPQCFNNVSWAARRVCGLLTVLLSQPVNDSPLETSRPGVVPLFGLSQVLRHMKGEIAILIFYMFMMLLLPECSNTVDWVAGMVYGL